MQKHFRSSKSYGNDDIMLMERIKLRDSKSFTILYAKYYRKMYAIVVRIVKDEDDAREIVQDVFLQVWQKSGYYDALRGPLVNWLITVAHNAALNFIRSSRVKKKSLEDKYEYHQFSELLTDTTIDTITALEESIREETSDQILTTLDRLPPEQREVLLRAYYQGQSHQEISEALHVPLGTIKTRMRLGVLKLRMFLKSGNPTVMTAH